MTDQLDIENDVNSTSEIGKFCLFLREECPDDQMFSMSSTLENIPFSEKHDCSLKNRTKVLVLSEPTGAYRSDIGHFLVSKIMAHKIMWVRTTSLKYIT